MKREPYKQHIWFCPDTQSQPFDKIKRAVFQPTNDNKGVNEKT